MKMGVCEVCKLVVETLRTFVDSNSTEVMADMHAGIMSWDCNLSCVLGSPPCGEEGEREGGGERWGEGGGAISSLFIKIHDLFNSLQGEAKTEVKKFCDKASFLKAECKELIDQYFPMIYGSSWNLMW